MSEQVPVGQGIKIICYCFALLLAFSWLMKFMAWMIGT